MNTVDVFDWLWSCLEDRGYVDGHGGMQYNRVRESWDQGDSVHLATAAAWGVVKHEVRSHMWPLLEVVVAAAIAIYAEANQPARD